MTLTLQDDFKTFDQQEPEDDDHQSEPENDPHQSESSLEEIKSEDQIPAQ